MNDTLKGWAHCELIDPNGEKYHVTFQRKGDTYADARPQKGGADYLLRSVVGTNSIFSDILSALATLTIMANTKMIILFQTAAIDLNRLIAVFYCLEMPVTAQKERRFQNDTGRKIDKVSKAVVYTDDVRQTDVVKELPLEATGKVSIRMMNDYLFKALLQRNERVRRALIAALLHRDPEEVRNVTITNPIRLGEYVDEKSIVLDVRVSFDAGAVMNLELQVVNEHNWVERSLYYACRNMDSLHVGDKYEDLQPVYQIGLLDFTLFPEAPAFYSKYRLLEETTHRMYTDKFTIGVLDLTKIHLANAEDKKYNVDGWAKLFKATTWEEVRMIAKQDVNIQDAAETVYQLSEDERVRQQCEAREDYIRRMNGWKYREEQNRKMLEEQEERLKEQKDQLKEQEDQLKEQEDQLKEQEDQLKEQSDLLEEKEKTIQDQEQLIAELRAKLAAAGIDSSSE